MAAIAEVEKYAWLHSEKKTKDDDKCWADATCMGKDFPALDTLEFIKKELPAMGEKPTLFVFWAKMSKGMYSSFHQCTEVSKMFPGVNIVGVGIDAVKDAAVKILKKEGTAMSTFNIDSLSFDYPLAYDNLLKVKKAFMAVAGTKILTPGTVSLWGGDGCVRACRSLVSLLCFARLWCGCGVLLCSPLLSIVAHCRARGGKGRKGWKGPPRLCTARPLYCCVLSPLHARRFARSSNAPSARYAQQLVLVNKDNKVMWVEVLKPSYLIKDSMICEQMDKISKGEELFSWGNEPEEEESSDEEDGAAGAGPAPTGIPGLDDGGDDY